MLRALCLGVLLWGGATACAPLRAPPRPSADTAPKVRSAASAPTCLPVDLGPRPPRLWGREAELAAALEALRARRPLFLWGPGGTGKSALLREAAYRLLERDTHTALRVPAGDLDPDALYTTLAAALCRPDLAQLPRPATKQERVAALLRERGAVLILEDLRDPTAEALAPLVQALAGVRLAISSRAAPPALAELAPLPLTDLAPAAALQLLRERLGRGGRCPLPSDDATLAELAALLGHNPLALTLATSAMRHRCRAPAAYLAELRKSDVQVRAAGADPAGRLDRLFDKAAEALGERRAAFDGLGVFQEGTFTAAALAAASGLPGGAEALPDLVALSLVEPEGARYRAHPLLRAFARQRLTQAEALEPALVRMTEHMNEVLTDAQHRAHPDDVRYGVELMKLACQLKAWPTCAGLADATVDWLHLHGYLSSAASVAALGGHAAEQVGGERLLQRLRGQEIRVRRALGDAAGAEALLRRNLAPLTEPDGRRAAALIELARARADADPQEAGALLREAQGILEAEQKDAPALLRATLLLCDVARRQGDTAARGAQLQRARELLQQQRAQLSPADQAMIEHELGRLAAEPQPPAPP